MSDLPSGTVTFLFTDIEGSTQLLKRLGARYGDLLAEHQRIVREAVAERRGREIDTQGDSFFFAFARANGAVEAAVLAQRALSEHAWPEGADVRVRMGLHTGEPAVGADRYVGLGVHRAARIGAVGHGGQVLLSNATRELLEDEPGAVSMRDLGSYRLKDIDRPERLFQLDIEGLQSEFPPLRAEKVAEPRLSRRTLLVAGLAGVLAAAVAIPIFALGQAGPGDESSEVVGTPEPGIPVEPNSVAVIDPKTNRVAVSIPVGIGPGPIAVGAGSVWVANVEEATVSRIDPKTRKVVATIGVGIEVSALAVDGDTVWVAGGRDSALLLIDARNNRIRRRLVIREKIGPLPAGYERGPSAVASGEGAIWLSHGEEVSRIDPKTNTVVATIPAGGNWSGAIAAGEGAIWVAENSSLQVRGQDPGFTTGISRIDPRSNVVTETVPIPGFKNPVTGASLPSGAIAVGEGAVWAAAPATDLLWRIDAGAERGMRSIHGGNEPGSVAAGEGAVWIENHSDETVVRIDPFSNELVRTIAIGGPTRGIAAGEGAVWVTVV